MKLQDEDVVESEELGCAQRKASHAWNLGGVQGMENPSQLWNMACIAWTPRKFQQDWIILGMQGKTLTLMGYEP